MRKNPNTEDEQRDNLDRWLITYADLITLLLAFFIMMYTFSTQDARKYQEVSDRLKNIFTGGSGVLKSGSAADSKKMEGQDGSVGAVDIEKELENEVAAISGALGQEHKVSVFRDERGIVIRTMDTALFDEGKAALKETAIVAMRKIVPTIEKSKRNLMIEGHTDNVPINTAEFKSNWELSTRRATEVVRHLIEKYDFPAQRISASGYAEFKPVADNDTPKHRALNRRIEIILLK